MKGEQALGACKRKMTQECKIECYRDLYAMFKQEKAVENLTYPESKKDYVFECTVKSVKIKCILRSERDLMRLTASMNCEGKSLEEVKKLGEKLADTHVGINSIPYNNKLVFQYSYPFSGIADPDAKRLCMENTKVFLDFVINLVNTNASNEDNKEAETTIVDGLDLHDEDEKPDEKIVFDKKMNEDMQKENIAEEEHLYVKKEYSDALINNDLNQENLNSEKNSDYGITESFDIFSDDELPEERKEEEISIEEPAKTEIAPEYDNHDINIQKVKDLEALVDSLKEKNLNLEKSLSQEKETIENEFVQKMKIKEDEFLQKMKTKENEYVLQISEYRKTVAAKEKEIDDVQQNMSKIMEEYNVLGKRLENEKLKYEADTTELRREIKALSESQREDKVVVENSGESEIAEIEDAYNCEIDQILKVNADLYKKLNAALNKEENIGVKNEEYEKNIAALKKQLEDEQIEKNQLKEKIEELEKTTETERTMMQAMQDTHEKFIKVVGEGKNIYKADIKGCEVTADLDKKMLYIKKACKKPGRFKNEIHQLNEQNIDELYYLSPEKICCKKMITKDFGTSLVDVLEKLNKMF